MLVAHCLTSFVLLTTERAPAPTSCLHSKVGINLHGKGYYLSQYWRRMTEKSRGRAAIRTWRRSASVVAATRPRGLHPTEPSTETSEEQCPAPSITPRCAACQIYHTNSSLSPLLPTLCATPLRLASASPRHLTLAPHCRQPCPTIATLIPTHGPPPHTSLCAHRSCSSSSQAPNNLSALPARCHSVSLETPACAETQLRLGRLASPLPTCHSEHCPQLTTDRSITSSAKGGVLGRRAPVLPGAESSEWSAVGRPS